VYTLLTETACKKGVFAIGGKDSFLVIKVEVVVNVIEDWC